MYLCAKDKDLHVSTIFLLDFGTVPTLVCVCVCVRVRVHVLFLEFLE